MLKISTELSPSLPNSAIRLAICIASVVVCLAVPKPAFAQRQVEQLDRGLVALHQSNDEVFLSWRLLATDESDAGFNVYRQIGSEAPRKLNDQVLVGPTHFIDRQVSLAENVSYQVRSIRNGVEVAEGKPYVLNAGRTPADYISIPISLPEGYHANDASVGDLDGDGQYEVVVHVASRGRDNSQGGMTESPIFHAYKLDGTLLWTINLGMNIREGAHYTQFLVYDFDGNGRAEFVCKTADGTVDGAGNVIGDPNADWRVPLPSQIANMAQNPPRANREGNSSERPANAEANQPRQRDRAEPTESGSQGNNAQRRGRRGQRVPSDVGKVLRGPEYLTIFDGQTGAAIDTVTYLPQRAPENDNPSRDEMNRIWGDSTGNRIDRFLATVAYLDGKRPSIIMSRGYYTRSVIAAWDLQDGKLRNRWVFDSDQEGPAERGNPWRGQGNHSMTSADVDQDGKDEIIFGAMVIDDNGQGLYSTRLGHGDAQHTSDLDPKRPGLEIWSIHENESATSDFVGTEMRDAKTGEIIFKGAIGQDVGRGVAVDIDPRHFGYEMWGGSNKLYNVKGEVIGPSPRSQNMLIWWDGDLLRELLDGVSINKWNYETATQASLFNGRQLGLASNNGTKSNPCLAADILGDWREELIARTEDNKELRIYVSTIPTTHRLVTLMHDPQYRAGIAWQNVGYNQPPHPSYFLGEGMTLPSGN